MVASTEKGLAYFVEPSTLDETLGSSGWTKVDESDAKHVFWNMCWKEKAKPEALYREKYVPRDALIEPSLEATAFPALTLNGTTRALCRVEYQRMYERLFACHKTKNARWAVAITGHPGIGKTIFGKYVLYRRCVDEEPTLYLDPFDRDLFLFHEGGVLRLGGNNIQSTSLGPFTRNTWILLDTRKKVEPPGFLTMPDENHPQIILTASPANRNTWIGWTKDSMVVRLTYMQRWKDYELQFGCVLHKMSWDMVEERHRVVGPVPQHLFACPPDYRLWEQEIREAAAATNFFSYEHLVQIFTARPLYGMSSGLSHYIQYQDRIDDENFDLILSDYVAQHLRRPLLRLSIQDREEIIRLYTYSWSHQIRVLTGPVYEIHILNKMAQLDTPLLGSIYRMVRLDWHESSADGSQADSLQPVEVPGSRKRKSGATEQGAEKRKRFPPQWYTAYGHPSKYPTLQAAREHSHSNPLTLELGGMDAVIYDPIAYMPRTIEDGKLYIPWIRGEAGIDAFYVDREKSVLSLFRMTVTTTAEVEMGILKLQERFQGLPEKWRLIFVQPYPTRLTVPYVESLSHIELLHVCIPPSDNLARRIPRPEEAQEVEEGEDEEEAVDKGDDAED